MRAHMNRVIQTFALWKTKAQISCTNVQADQALVTHSLDTLYTVTFNSDISSLCPTKLMVNMQDFALVNIQNQCNLIIIFSAHHLRCNLYGTIPAEYLSIIEPHHKKTVFGVSDTRFNTNPA